MLSPFLPSWFEGPFHSYDVNIALEFDVITLCLDGIDCMNVSKNMTNQSILLADAMSRH